MNQKTKSYYVNAGKGDDIIWCYADFDDYDEYGSRKVPSVSFKGGKGSDIFVGVPEGGLTGRVKDFNVKEDILGFDGDIHEHRFYKTAQGLAIVHMHYLDGLLILEGVDSFDQIKTTNDVDIF